MGYYIFNLERLKFWKNNKIGYTNNIEEAGRYTEKESYEIISDRYNKKNIRISENDIGELKNII